MQYCQMVLDIPCCAVSYESLNGDLECMTQTTAYRNLPFLNFMILARSSTKKSVLLKQPSIDYLDQRSGTLTGTCSV